MVTTVSKQPQPKVVHGPAFVILSGSATLFSSIANVILMITFFLSGDVVWASSLLFFILVSTLFNILITAVDHPVKNLCCLWTALSLLQLKAWGDTIEFLTHPRLKNPDYANEEYQSLIKSFRVKRFLSSVVQSLPVSFLLTYVLMLDLHNRINEHILGGILFLSFLSFALGTTHFVAGNNSYATGFIVFLHVLAQFIFRMLAVCSVCVRFRSWGVLAIMISWLFVYLFGPKGTFSLWTKILTCHSSSTSHEGSHRLGRISTAFLRVFLTPLTFFIVVDVLYEVPEHPNEPVKAYDSFKDTLFVLWRMVENAVLVACFVFIPRGAHERGADEYEKWLSHPTTVGIVSLVTMLTAISTWFVVVSPPQQAYQQQVDKV
eukprot:c2227_g1_i1.p1 GENE.c2227_g1_i1~~c2227_g1_i1.p1  ORF type:complete len:403 (+),score=64.74 c2227_g1_i1:82-1209(+)